MEKQLNSTKLLDTVYLYVDVANPTRSRRFIPDCDSISGKQLALEYVYSLHNKKRDAITESIKKERLDFFTRKAPFHRGKQLLDCAEGQIQHLVEESMQRELEFKKSCIQSLGDYLNNVFPIQEQTSS